MEQINEALIVRIVAEFQGYFRDLHNLATDRIVQESGCSPALEATLIKAATLDRRTDGGNPRLDSINHDLERIGIAQPASKIKAAKGNARQHDRDVAELDVLFRLRNAIAHADDEKRRSIQVRPTLAVANSMVAVLNRQIGALDRVVWEHLYELLPAIDPWRAR